MISSCPFCKLGRKFLSDDRDFPRLIENGIVLVPNIHRYYNITLIQCNNCENIWLFRGEPSKENMPAIGFYYNVDKDEFNNIDKMKFTEFIDFCISELHSFKVGNFAEENIKRYLIQDMQNVNNVIKTKREFPAFILEFLLKSHNEFIKNKNI